jgi:hypothetical protein
VAVLRYMKMNENMVSIDMVWVVTRRKYTSTPNPNVRYSLNDRTGAGEARENSRFRHYTNKTIRFRLLRLLRCRGI